MTKGQLDVAIDVRSMTESIDYLEFALPRMEKDAFRRAMYVELRKLLERLEYLTNHEES